MNDLITLLIPTYKRHSYLSRSLAYYGEFGIRIIVADSSPTPFTGENLLLQCTYLHLPNHTLTQKIAEALDVVTTPLVVMCADDDFIVRTALNKCVTFLSVNPYFSAVCGNAIAYSKESAQRGKVEYSLIYEDNFSYEIVEDDPLERLKTLFRDYRNFFYAVHRTNVLQSAFNASAGCISNLFLNEYITAIIPVVAGKFKEMPLLYHVREFAIDSGDKTTLNLDSISGNPQLRVEYDNLVATQAAEVAKMTGKQLEQCRQIIEQALQDHAQKLPAMRNIVDKSIDKKIGAQILKIPFLGKRIIGSYRHMKRRKKLLRVITTQQDKNGLVCIARAILNAKAGG